MLKFYGNAQSRAARCLWALEEIQVPFQHIQVDANAGETNTPEYREINPAGKIPALVDGDLRLAESMAINIYLARKYGNKLWIRGEKEEARLLQWSFWVMTEFEPHILTIGRQGLLAPERRSPERAKEASLELDRALPALDAALGKSAWLLDDTSFSIADLNVASVLALTLMIPLDLSAYCHLQRWLSACFERSAFRRVFSVGE